MTDPKKKFEPANETTKEKVVRIATYFQRMAHAVYFSREVACDHCGCADGLDIDLDEQKHESLMTGYVIGNCPNCGARTILRFFYPSDNTAKPKKVLRTSFIVNEKGLASQVLSKIVNVV